MTNNHNHSNFRLPSRTTTLCAAVTLLLAACGNEPAAPSAQRAAAAAPAVAAAPAAAPAAESVPALVARANKAFAEQRFVAPAGDNALELFIQVRTLDPKHAGAQEALVELFPMTVSAIKSQLARDELDEARRMIALLDQAMPDSRAVVDLRSDLDRRQKALAAAEAAKAAAEAAALARRNAPEPKPVAATPVAETPQPEPETRIAQPAPAQPKPTAPGGTTGTSGATAPMQAVAIAATTGAAPAPSAAKPAAPDAPEFTSPVAVARYPAEYPQQAKQRRVEGWVELEFTVDVNGTVKDVAILGAEPPKVFDRAAQRALMRWKFKPAARGGKPESARTRTTISFKLG